MLDTDLAALYKIEPRALIQACRQADFSSEFEGCRDFFPLGFHAGSGA
jgi:hypothetical protein